MTGFFNLGLLIGVTSYIAGAEAHFDEHVGIVAGIGTGIVLSLVGSCLLCYACCKAFSRKPASTGEITNNSTGAYSFGHTPARHESYVGARNPAYAAEIRRGGSSLHEIVRTEHILPNSASAGTTKASTRSQIVDYDNGELYEAVEQTNDIYSVVQKTKSHTSNPTVHGSENAQISVQY